MSTEDSIPAPYGFVPLNPQVAAPEWASSASRDVPYEDGINGTFRVQVEAMSPIFVRGTKAKDLPFELPDGRHALPGSAVRGMLRNVVEIATLGKMSRVNDHRYALRDLHNQRSYVSQMARIEGGQPVPLVNAGWLVPGETDGEHQIHPCHFAKLEYGILQGIAAELFSAPGFDPGRKQSSVEKYQRLFGWKAPERPGQRPPGAPDDWASLRLRPVKLQVEKIPRPIRDLKLPSEYGKVKGPGETRCHVVMTGQPSPYVPNRPKGRGSGNPKHHDFVFHGSAGPAIPVPEEVFRAFEFGHSDRGQQNNLGRSVEPNPEWGLWRSLVWGHAPEWFEGKPERGVPVFFLLHPGGELRAIGLAMMFRLAARTSVLRGVQDVQPGALEAKPFDFAETLFGVVDDRRRAARGDDEESAALAGRVSFGVARADAGARPASTPVKVVLGTPKASYYPSYVEQGPGPGEAPGRDAKNKPDWTTWSEPNARPRGWKRYRPIEGHKTITPPPPKGGDGRVLDISKVGTTFRPLPTGTRFELTVRVHNVRPEELGAILWALDLGGAEGAFHKLGLARPLGYGTVRLRPSAFSLDRNDGAPVDPAAAVSAFTAWMNKEWTRLGGAGTWEDSRTIRELVALAKPIPADDARHMMIDHPVNRNEFQRAKLDGRVLLAASRGGGWLPATARASPAPVAAGAAPAKPAAGGLPSAGQRVRVRLTGQNKNNRWQAELVGGSGSGTLVRGEAPADAAVGTEHEVAVFRASSRLNIELEWK